MTRRQAPEPNAPRDALETLAAAEQPSWTSVYTAAPELPCSDGVQAVWLHRRWRDLIRP